MVKLLHFMMHPLHLATLESTACPSFFNFIAAIMFLFLHQNKEYVICIIPLSYKCLQSLKADLMLILATRTVMGSHANHYLRGWGTTQANHLQSEAPKLINILEMFLDRFQNAWSLMSNVSNQAWLLSILWSMFICGPFMVCRTPRFILR